MVKNISHVQCLYNALYQNLVCTLGEVGTMLLLGWLSACSNFLEESSWNYLINKGNILTDHFIMYTLLVPDWTPFLHFVWCFRNLLNQGMSVLRPALLAQTTMAHSKSPKSSFFPLILGLNCSNLSSRLDA